MVDIFFDNILFFFTAFLFYKPEAVPNIFKDLNADHQRMFDLLKESQLKWIAVLPPHIAGVYYNKYYITYNFLRNY